MVQYECEKCHKLFTLKGDYTRHLNKKKPCIKKSTTIPHITPKNTDLHVEDKLVCNYCHEKFSRSDSLNRHIREYCKVKKSDDDTKEQLLQKLLNEHENMKQRIQTLEEKNKEYQKIINTQNNTQNINIKDSTINFNVSPYGNEDTSFISEETFKKIINKGFNSVPALVDEIHFNKNKPENHNIYISNLRDDYVLVFDGNDWNLETKESVLTNMYYANSDILELKFKEFFDKLDKYTIKKFERFINKKDDDTVINDIKKDLKVLLYNRRKIVSTTRKLISK
jgi:hypothetical protein